MDEKKTIKVSLGTTICIIIIILLVIALGGMYYYYNSNSKNTDSVNQSAIEKEENKIDKEVTDIKANKISKLDESKDLVYSSFSKYSSQYSYSIPYINIDSADVKKINNEIESYYKPLVAGEIANEAKGLSVIMDNVKYTSYVNDNTLSLVVSHEYPNDCIGYKVYNIDIYKGTIITNDNILSMKKINESEYLDILKDSYKQEFINTYGTQEKYINSINGLQNGSYNLTESELQKEKNNYNTLLNKTIASDNYSTQTPMFLNEKGKICVIGKIYSLVGAESYDHIINTNI